MFEKLLPKQSTFLFLMGTMSYQIEHKFSIGYLETEETSCELSFNLYFFPLSLIQESNMDLTDFVYLNGERYKCDHPVYKIENIATFLYNDRFYYTLKNSQLKYKQWNAFES